jgi:hypothetical protein
MCLPTHGAFTIKQNRREIYVPADMNTWARHSSDDFWKWFTDVKNKDNLTHLRLSYDDIKGYEVYKGFHHKPLFS